MPDAESRTYLVDLDDLKTDLTNRSSDEVVLDAEADRWPSANDTTGSATGCCGSKDPPMTDLDPTTLSAHDLTAYLAALADTDPNADTWGDNDKPQCGAWGPHGECHRKAGHLDGAWAINLHVTFDRDHYDDWPVGWRSSENRMKTVLDPTFGQHVLDGTAVVSDDFRAGFKAALDLMRGVLTPKTGPA